MLQAGSLSHLRILVKSSDVSINKKPGVTSENRKEKGTMEREEEQERGIADYK